MRSPFGAVVGVYSPRGSPVIRVAGSVRTAADTIRVDLCVGHDRGAFLCSDDLSLPREAKGHARRIEFVIALVAATLTLVPRIHLNALRPTKCRSRCRRACEPLEHRLTEIVVANHVRNVSVARNTRWRDRDGPAITCVEDKSEWLDT